MAARFNEAERSAVRAHLDDILGSEPFLKSGRRQRFLEYIVTETLEGRGGALKGYSVAVDVFDRPATFDPALDPIVRVEAGRLREKLRDYYASAGRPNDVRIELPKGRYAPRIEIGTGPSALARRGREPDAARPTLAVLPFVNLSGDRSNDYLGDGLADELVTDLGRISGLRVVSRHSSFLCRNPDLPLANIADALKARFIIEGSVQVERAQVRVSANVLDPASGGSLWSARFKGDRRELFSMQDQISRGVASALSVKLTPRESELVGRRGTESTRAHDALLKGLSLFCGYSETTCAEAQDHFREATRLDPAYAAPHTWLARSYVLQHCMNWRTDVQSPLEPAVAHAQTAVALDGDAPLAHAVHGWTLLFLRDGEAALAAARRACAIDPCSPDGRMFQALIEASTGRTAEADLSIEAAMALQPLPSSFCFYALGMCRFAAADYDGAREALLRSTEVNPAFLPAHYALAITYGVCGRDAEAVATAAIVRLKAPFIAKTFFLAPGPAKAYLAGRRAGGLG